MGRRSDPMTNRYVKDDAIDEWAAAKVPALTYEDGKPVLAGDHVDWLADDLPSRHDEPYGIVVEAVIGAGLVIVDATMGTREAVSPDNLTLRSRMTDENRAKFEATLRRPTPEKEATP
jgi:hypothetical protein